MDNQLGKQIGNKDLVGSLLADFLDRLDRGEKPDPEQFAHGDPELAKKLQQCLDDLKWLGGILTADSNAQPSGSETRTLGRYRLLREIGRGGMGVVYEAVHQDLDRRVALKVLGREQTVSQRKRFRREAQTLASLHHTNIVPVFEIGEQDRTQFIAMQFIDGVALDGLSNTEQPGAADLPNGQTTMIGGSTYRESNASRRSGESTLLSEIWPRLRNRASGGRQALPPLAVARIGLQAADALAYAHSRGVVHRDIKPSNLIVDSKDTVWVADFGLARRPSDPTVTVQGVRLGTPRYMSPEQSVGDWELVDHRTDIYSLGATLYELSTGVPLVDGESHHEILRNIGKEQRTRPRAIEPAIPRDLETVILKAVSGRPQDRYQSAADFAEDLSRLLAHQPIKARRIGPIGRFVRWSRREPMMASLCSLLVIAALVVGGFAHKRVVDQRDFSRREHAMTLYGQASALLESDARNRRFEAIELLSQAAAVDWNDRLRAKAFEALQLFNVESLRSLAKSDAAAAAIDSGGQRIAVSIGGTRPQIRVFSNDGHVLEPINASGAYQFLRFDPTGRYLAATTDDHLVLYHLEEGLELLRIDTRGYSTVDFSPGGDALVGVSTRGVQVWKTAETGEQRERTLVSAESPYGFVRFASATRLVSWTSDLADQVRVWSWPQLESQQPIQLDYDASKVGAAFGPVFLEATNDLVAVSRAERGVQIWNLAEGSLHRTLNGHRAPATSLQFCRDGDQLVTSDGFETFLWDTSTGRRLASLIELGDARPGYQVVAGAGLHELVTTGDRCRQWRVHAPIGYRQLGRLPGTATTFDFEATSGRSIWTAGNTLWQTKAGQQVESIEVVGGAVSTARVIPGSGELLVVQEDGRRAFVLEAGSDKPKNSLELPGAIVAAAHPDGAACLFACAHGQFLAWDPRSGRSEQVQLSVDGRVVQLQFSRDGRTLAVGTSGSSEGGGSVFMFRAQTWEPMWRQRAHRGSCRQMAFSPDGRRVATAGDDEKVVVWDVATGVRRHQFDRHSSFVSCVAFGPDGRLAVSGDRTGAIWLWDSAGENVPVRLFSYAGDSVQSIGFNTDGTEVLVAVGPYQWLDGSAGAVELWDLGGLRRELSRLGFGRLEDYRR